MYDLKKFRNVYLVHEGRDSIMRSLTYSDLYFEDSTWHFDLSDHYFNSKSRCTNQISHFHSFIHNALSLVFLGFLNGNFFSITYKFWSLIKKISKKCWLPHIFFNATVILFYFILFFLNLINNQNIIPFIIADFPGKKIFSSARKHTYPPTSAPPTLWGLGRPSFFQRPRFPTDFARFYIIINVLLLSQIILQ